MAKSTQEGRLLSISTNLPYDTLLIDKFKCEEAVSELFSIEAELLRDEVNEDPFEFTPVDINEILGQRASIRVRQPDGNERVFTGIFQSFAMIGRDSYHSRYRATIVPHIWKLTQVFRSRIFQDMPVPDILTEVFDGFETKFQLQRTYKRRNYCVQYQESDFDFASRVMEEEGIYYYFEHSPEVERVIFRDNYKNPEDCAGKSTIGVFNERLDTADAFVSSVKNFNFHHELRSGKFVYRDYNFQLPTKTLDAEQASLFSIGGNQELEVYKFPGGYARHYDGIDSGGGEQTSELNNIFDDNKLTAKHETLSIDVEHKLMRAYSDCCSFTAGYRFKLENHPNKDVNQNYVLIRVKHSADQNPSYVADTRERKLYGNEFYCLPHGSGHPEFRPKCTTRKPVMMGTQTAFVVGPAGEEIFTDKYGRVKVQFPWHREGKNDAGSSCWVRVAKDLAGNRYGSMYIPRIGQEVLVDFLGGNPDQPIITGSLYNPESMPHYELPKFKTLTYIKTRTSPDDGKGFNEIRFEDKKGKEQVFMHSQKRWDTRIKGSFYETCGGNRQERVGVRSDNQPGGNLAITVGGNYDLHVKSGTYIGIDGELNEGVKGNVIEGYDGNQQTLVNGNIEINARSITLEGSQKVTLKVGSSFIVVDMMGVTIVGPMVKINSGGAATPTGPATISDPLDADSADTGEPGYLDRPRKGGGKKGRNRRTLNGLHAPSVKKNADGTYSVGGDKLKVKGDEEYTSKVLSDLSTLYNTPTGKKVMDKINNGKHETTIETLDEATARRNGALATRLDKDGSVTPGKGSGTKVQYNPDVPDSGYTDENGDAVTLPKEAMLGHELIHAVHNDEGKNLRDNPEPAEPDSNEEESQTIGIHGHKDDELTHNNILKEMGSSHRRTDHDTSVVTAED